MQIRLLDMTKDIEELAACVIELQDFEKSLDARLPSGRDLIDDYLPDLFQRREEYDGEILVAELDGAIVGYVAVWTKHHSEELVDGDFVHGLVADLSVREKFRKQGIGTMLMQAAENYARDRGVQFLRVGVLAQNQNAKILYESLGFSDLSTQMEKDLAQHR